MHHTTSNIATADRAPARDPVNVIMTAVVEMTGVASGETTRAACLLRTSDLAPGLVLGRNRDHAGAALPPTHALLICVHVYARVRVHLTVAGTTTRGTLTIVCGTSSNLVVSLLVLVPGLVLVSDLGLVLVEAVRQTTFRGDLAVPPLCSFLHLLRLASLVSLNSTAVSENLGSLEVSRDQWHLAFKAAFKCKAFVVEVEVVVEAVVVPVVSGSEGLGLHLDMHNLCVSDLVVRPFHFCFFLQQMAK